MIWYNTRLQVAISELELPKSSLHIALALEGCVSELELRKCASHATLILERSALRA